MHEDRVVEAVGATEQLKPGESVPTGVRRIEASTTESVQAASVARVAVIDTGIDLSHPDLPSAIDGVNCVVPGLRTQDAQDDHGHGTHVAGTIAAANAGPTVQGAESLVGVAPATPVVAVKVLTATGAGLWSQVICGIDWVTSTRKDGDPGNDVAVANMSLGGDAASRGGCDDLSDSLHKAICASTNAGVTYVVAAGNDGKDFAESVPARSPEVLTVTAMSDSDGMPAASGGAPSCRTSEKDDSPATFSNYAVAPTEANHAIAGPGVCIRSTWPGGLITLDEPYHTISGTSMAAPHVAGTVAFCIGNGNRLCAGLSPTQIIQKVRDDAKAHATLDNGYGFQGDPLRPVTSGGRKKVTAYYGYLVWAGGY